MEAIVLDRQACLRLTQTVGGRCFLDGYFDAPDELTPYVDLADLVEVIQLPARRA